MPCTSNYPDPTEQQLRNQHAAKLLIYVRLKLKKIVPASIHKDMRNVYCDSEKGTQLLCADIAAMTVEQQEAIIYNAKSRASRSLANWWEAHQRADRERERRAKEEKKKAKFIASAKAKLTIPEQKALGIYDKEDFS